MPMNRAQKATLLAEFDKTFAEAKGVVFANYRGLKVKELEQLRDEANNGAMTMRITKNTILKIAARRHNIELDEALLSQPLTMIASREDEIVAAKTLKTFAKEHEALQIAGGVVGNRFLSVSEVKALADLPGKDQLRAQLVGVLASPLVGLVRTLQAPLAGLVNVLHQYKTSRE